VSCFSNFTAIAPAFIQESSVGTEKGRSQDILITVGYGVIGIAAANVRNTEIMIFEHILEGDTC
jgi:hypothetical protein